MKLERLIQKLLPHDDNFYTLLEESSANIVRASELMVKFSRTRDRRAQQRVVNQIKEAEHRGDDVTHTIFNALNATFVTPFDREDIYRLASSMDDIIDHIDGSANRFTLYDLGVCPPQMVRLIEVLHQSVVELHRAISLLRRLHEYDSFQEVFKKVHQFENDADALFEQAVADLFQKEKRNPILVIKVKEIYDGLERATDKCEDAANVLEGIVIKNA